MRIADLDTPSVLVDLDIAEANILAFQAHCTAHGLALRPHIKTHKLPRIAEFQLQAGAVGITCQKVSEAEAMAAHGPMRDILITYNILGEAKLARLRRLAERVALSVVADNAAVVAGLARAFADAPAALPVLVECNTGADRCGVATPEAAADLAQAIAACPGLRFGGLMTYPPIGKPAEVAAWLGRARLLIQARGLEVEVVSSGGSPGMWRAQDMSLATEYRAGTYVYNDGSLVARGTCGWQDCALTVLTTVVSVPAPDRAVIDAGSKVLTSDLLGLVGHGHVLGRPDLVIDQLSEEHGRLRSSAGEVGLQVGQQLRIVPNHACVVTNMLDQVVLVRGPRVIGPEKVVARGQVW